jgi:hypothetical protein
MKSSPTFVCVIAVIATLVQETHVVHAQVSTGGFGQSRQNASVGNYYSISKPGEFTIEVNIWGSVRSPGRYEVGTSTDLVQLVSYAGGPTPDASLTDVRVTRFIKREGGSITKQQFEVNLEDLYKADDTKLGLFPGDTIYLDHTGSTVLRDAISYLTSAAVVTSAIASIIIASRYGR